MATPPLFPMMPGADDPDKDTPLPLLVSQKWEFPLAYVETEAGYLYAVQDWIKGLTSAEDIRFVWAKMKDKSQLLISIQQLPYISTDSKTYQMDFTDDKGLYLIAQYMRVTKARPALGAIKEFLAEAGVFVDQVRRDPETVITSGAIDPDKAVEAAIKTWRAQGKDERWIRVRLEGKIKREKFTSALKAAVAQLLNSTHYATATNDIYRGLWRRTAAQLLAEMALPENANLRDHQPTLALQYQSIAEEVCAQHLNDETELTWGQARQIVQEVAEFVGKQAREMSTWLKKDIATGKPLLTG